MSTHVMTWEVDQGVVHVRLDCRAPEMADCRIDGADDCHCDAWTMQRTDDGRPFRTVAAADGTQVVHWMRDTGTCSAAALMAGGEEACGGRESFALAALPVDVAWDSELGCTWSRAAPAPDVTTVTVPRPHVDNGPAGVPVDKADADYLRHAARAIERHYKPFGRTLRATVVKLLLDTADAIHSDGHDQGEQR